MADVFDQATAREETDRDAAIKAHLHAQAVKAARPSLHDCEDCGDEIPQARREAVPGCRTCCDCGTKRERRR